MLSKKLVVKNSLVSLIAQFISLLLGFVTRRIFLYYLGIEIQGLNSVIGETLGFLSLAELGIGSAITYRLYKPLVEKDEDEIASLMLLYRQAYRVIGAVVFVVGIAMMLILPVIIKEQSMEYSFIYVVYLIQLVTSVSTYFFAYKRSLLYTDQKQYICKLVDLFMNVAFSILRIAVMILYRNYMMYLVLQLAQSILSNMLVSVYCNKCFPYLNKKQVKTHEEVKDIFKDTKDILFGKIAGYIWSSTDSIVVSTFSGLVQVGGLSNYKYVINAARNVLHSITEPIAATIGNYLQVKDKEDSLQMLKSYIFFRFVMIDIVATGLIVCTDSFVAIVFGEQYILPKIISVLIVTDIFIGVIYGPMADMINLLGYFSEDKIINFLGAFANLFFSILFVQRYGMTGVLIGTCISQAIFWVGKTTLVCKKFFVYRNIFWDIWKNYLSYVVVVILQIAIIEIIVDKIVQGRYSVLGFALQVTVCILITSIVLVFVYGRSKECKYLWNIIKGLFREKK